MSPRNLGDKYRCRPPPPVAKVHAPFFFFVCVCVCVCVCGGGGGGGGRACESNGTRVASSLGDNVVGHVVCLKSKFLWHNGLSNENGKFYTYYIYPYLNRSVCLLMGSPTWWGFSFCLRGSSLVLWWRDAPLVREFQMWSRRCKQRGSHWF